MGVSTVCVAASHLWPAPCPQTTIQRCRCHSPRGAGWHGVVPSVALTPPRDHWQPKSWVQLPVPPA